MNALVRIFRWCLGSEYDSKDWRGLQRVARDLSGLGCAILVGCGGGGDSPLTPAQAQAAPQIEVARFDFILRPDATGHWYIQNDIDHAALGVLPNVEQGPDYLAVYFDRAYTHAGVIQISSDDDFGPAGIHGYSNLGLGKATIRVVAGGKVIDPATVLSYTQNGAGNFWVSVTMVNKP